MCSLLVQDSCAGLAWGQRERLRESEVVQEDWRRRSCSHVSFSCREGTGDMRAALFLTWSFNGSSSFHLVIHAPRLQTHTLSLSLSLRKFASPPVHEMHHACMATCQNWAPTCIFCTTAGVHLSYVQYAYVSWYVLQCSAQLHQSHWLISLSLSGKSCADFLIRFCENQG